MVVIIMTMCATTPTANAAATVCIIKSSCVQRGKDSDKN